MAGDIKNNHPNPQSPIRVLPDSPGRPASSDFHFISKCRGLTCNLPLAHLTGVPLKTTAPRPGGVLGAENLIPKAVVLVLWGIIYVQERRAMGQAALETALNELTHAFLLPVLFFFLLPTVE